MVSSGQNGGMTTSAYTIGKSVPSDAVFTDTTSFTITANATDGLWDLTGTNGTNAVTYALAPYSAKQSTAAFYTATTNPTLTTRLNYDGYFYATKLYSGGTEVKTSQTAITDSTGTADGSNTSVTFIYSFSQTANGVVSAKTRSLNTSGTWTGTSTWATLIKPIASTTTASASTWNIPTGSKQVWGERFSDTTLKWTNNGTEATVTDTGDLVMWLTSGGTSNTATLNMRIDGTYYGNLSGNATTATTATNLANNPSIQASTSNTNQVTITAGGKTSTAYTIPYATSAGSSTNASNLVSNKRMDYGWNGINYFNISAANQSAAKVNDTPSSSAVWWHILRFNHGNNAGYYSDLAVPFNANSLYYKRVANGALQNNTTNGGWVQVLDQLNYTNYTVTKTGGGASGSWGINVTGTAANVTGTVAIDHGGTGQTTLTAARAQFSGPEFIVGTWSAASNVWTGKSTDSALYDGKQIILYMPFAGTNSAATLNLTLSDGSTTGAKNVYFESTTRFTTHKGQNSQLHLIYHKALKLSNGTTYEGWWYVANRDTTTTNATQIQYNGGVKSGASALAKTNIIVAGSDGLYKHLKAGTAFEVTLPILYLSADTAANTATTSVYSEVNFTVTTTQSITLTAYKPVFIKGTLTGTSCTPVSTAPLTQTIPTTDDGYVYILLGFAYSATAIRLQAAHPIFWYKNEKFRAYDGGDGIKAITRSGTTFTVTRTDGSTFTFTQQDNNTTYTFAEGSTNGTFSVTPSGGSAQSVTVHGVLTAHQTIKQEGITGATINRFGTCSTEAGKAAKTVTITSGTFNLEAGARVTVKFSAANTANNPTLNVASKGAKNIFHKGTQITTGDNKALLAGTVDFVYDGTQWHLVGNYIDTKNAGTVTSITLKAGTGISLDTDNTAITSSGTRTISLKAATTTSIGGIQVNYTTSGKNYKVQLDSNNNAYVNVPWTDTNTLVKQTVKTDSVNRKILTGTIASPTSGTAYEAYYSANIYANASTNALSAMRLQLNVSGTDKAYAYYNTSTDSIDFIFV